MNHRIQTSILCAIFAIAAMAQSEATDSIKTQELNEVVVEAQLQFTSATVSTYLPTKCQCNAVQNGPELLNHMAITQLGLAQTLQSPQATKQLVDSLVKTDAEGHTSLNIPVPNKETVEQMLNVFSKLFQSIK